MPTLHTARLILRPPRLADAQAIFDAYAQDAEVTRYLIWSPHVSITETEEFLRRSLDDVVSGTHLPWVITTKTDERLIGMIDLRP